MLEIRMLRHIIGKKKLKIWAVIFNQYKKIRHICIRLIFKNTFPFAYKYEICIIYSNTAYVNIIKEVHKI